ncbi:MAG: serine/threonine protein kinase, partial [Deltaproteobacteria bacterium]|nr:serine/threonine protein kinase [Deltaproteobacteria bacterium]
MKHCPKCNRKFDNSEKVCPFDNLPLAETSEDSLVGTILDNRYRVTDKIGEGGMGKVYKAEHTILGKPFALKVLNPELAKREDSLKRFVNEAKLTSKLGHPNIVEVTDFGRTPTGSFYFVMEYVRGKTLYDLLCQSKTIPADKSADILIQCADALYAAHGEGII